ncbi:MAG: hypothetical protein VB046_12540 [Paludibacter sp.]|jgi:hypothetical protein|nr:hypothetical protein [Paludibacter sp.]
MKHLLSTLCLLCLVLSVFSKTDTDSLCFRLAQFEEIRRNNLLYKTDNEQICSNFNIIELPTDSNRMVMLYEFENIESETSPPGYILIENNMIEIYDLHTFSHLIKRIINSDVHPETLKSWIKIILQSYDMLLFESSSNIILKYNKGQCDFYVTTKSINKKND